MGVAPREPEPARHEPVVPDTRSEEHTSELQSQEHIAYEWSKGETLAQPPRVDEEPPAPQAELDGLVSQLDAMLDAAGFYFPPDKVPTVMRNIRSILTKPGWNAQELRTLRGVLTAIEKPRPKT